MYKKKKTRILKCKNQHILLQMTENQVRLTWFKSSSFSKYIRKNRVYNVFEINTTNNKYCLFNFCDIEYLPRERQPNM